MMKYGLLVLLLALCLLAGCGAEATPVVHDTAPSEDPGTPGPPEATDTRVPDTPPPADTDTPIPPPPIDTRVRETDGMVMVYVPEGEFLMGGELDNEQPEHTVYLDAFWIDETEVTNSQYEQCVAAGVCTASGCVGNDDYNGTQHPVVCVDWEEAVAYCQWSGAQLPTEAEWEKAARGIEGNIYPWGDIFDGSRVNFCDRNCDDDRKDAEADDGYAKTAPVGSYPAGISPYGALDMVGNASEWVADWYDREYYARSPERNPLGPDSGAERVLRGGAWLYPQPIMHASIRDYARPSFSSGQSGFRCALDATVP